MLQQLRSEPRRKLPLGQGLQLPDLPDAQLVQEQHRRSRQSQGLDGQGTQRRTFRRGKEKKGARG